MSISSERIVFVLFAAAAALLWQEQADAAQIGTDAEPSDPGGFSVSEWVDSLFGTDGMTPTTSTAAGNRAAFLAMIRKSEGTAGPNGYRTFYGGSLFSDLSAHPNTPHTAAGITSTAAGAYQFLFRTWEECRRALSLPDFSPESQDAAAVFLIKRRGALPDVDAGNFAAAVAACRKEWASLPGAGYGQHENTLASLQAAYVAAGGVVA
jgi:muramidase (phage lysozyme)